MNAKLVESVLSIIRVKESIVNGATNQDQEVLPGYSGKHIPELTTPQPLSQPWIELSKKGDQQTATTAQLPFVEIQS